MKSMESVFWPGAACSRARSHSDGGRHWPSHKRGARPCPSSASRLRRIMGLLFIAVTLGIGIAAYAQQPGSADPPGASKTDAQEDPKSAARPDLVGHVAGRGTAPEATIFIFTAGPKVGTSTFCPSCYADCRKSAKTDEQGNFKIESLDPQLIFRILVVAKGFTPRFVTKVDPANGPVNVYLQRVDLTNVTPDRSIRGQVVDASGKP